VHCQLETLRFCFPPSIRRVLDELPETLDATYERALLEISKQTRDYACRLFRCLVASIRPLRVEELAELFAIQPYGDTTLGLNSGWRPEDPEEFILSVCSTLVSIANIRGERVVHFSHFSVREYLTSDRIANSLPVSHFHVLPKPAHTLLARACLSVLFELPHDMNITRLWNFPLAGYAAEHWVEHAQFEDVSSDIRDWVDCLFDRNKPHLDNWIWLYDGCHGSRYHLPHHPRRVDQVPLYYAALFGFRDLVERLVVAHPGHVNSRGDYLGAPLNAAIYNGHVNIALFLLERGADVESRGWRGQTALYMSSSPGYTEVVQSLIDRGADPNTECDDWNDNYQVVKWTPLHVALRKGRMEIARVLLEHGADVNYQDKFGKSSLHLASRHRSNDLARLLLDHGANLNALDTWGETALHSASSYGKVEVVTLLLEYGANVDARSNPGRAPLHCAADAGHLEVVQVLLDHDADVNAHSRSRWTALHEAAFNGHLQVVNALMKRGADPNARTDQDETPFQVASQRRHTQIEQFLSEHTGEGM
jgi:ankyrin repeat protein